MSAKFPRGGGAGPFLARSLLCYLEITQLVRYHLCRGKFLPRIKDMPIPMKTKKVPSAVAVAR